MKHFIIAIIVFVCASCATTMTPQQALDQAVLAQECMDILTECVTEGKAAKSDGEILDAFRPALRPWTSPVVWWPSTTRWRSWPIPVIDMAMPMPEKFEAVLFEVLSEQLYTDHTSKWLDIFGRATIKSKVIELTKTREDRAIERLSLPKPLL